MGSSKKRGSFEEERVLRSSGPKIEEPPSSILGLEDRRTPSHLQSSIFEAEDRRSPHLRSSASKNGSEIDGRRGGTSSSEERRTSPSSTFSTRRTNNSLYLPSSRPEEWTKKSLVLLLPTLSPRPPAPVSYVSSGLDLQTDLSPWGSIRRSRSALYSVHLSPGRTVLSAFSSARPRSAAHRTPRLDPPVVCPGFEFDS